MSVRVVEDCTVEESITMSTGYSLISLWAPKIADLAQPGQFIFVRCRKSTAPLLRRPISICSRDKKAGLIRMLVKVVGQGTEILTKYRRGQVVDVMGPIGTGFPVVNNSQPVVIGGGIGVAPLVFLAEQLAEVGSFPHVILGAATKKQLFFVNELSMYGEVKVMTEDGSYGEQGVPTIPLAIGLRENRYSHIYACGPQGMLSTASQLAKEYNVPGYVSLEERLACGIGACNGCAFPVMTATGQRSYKKVCVDGPVFSVSEVIFN